MRIYGRVVNTDGVKTWEVVQTTSSGRNDGVYLTWLCQALLLNYGESPFYGAWGIPAEPSVVNQVPPDYYVNLTQQRFAQYFASLIVAKQPAPINQPTPTYNISIILQSGANLSPIVLSGGQITVPPNTWPS